MTHLRAILRIIGIGAGTVALLAMWGIAWFGCLGSSRRAVRLRSWIVNRWGKMVARVMGMSISVEGTPPAPPFILVANHVSYVDAILIHATVRGVLVSRADVAGWPVIGWLARRTGTLFIDRKRIRDVVRLNEQMRKVLDRGDGVIFFPEGTSTSGEAVTKFRSPLLNVAAKERYPVHHAAIHYASDTFNVREHVCWWRDMTFTDHLYSLLKRPGFQARIRFGETPAVADERKDLADDLETRVRSRFEPIGYPA